MQEHLRTFAVLIVAFIVCYFLYSAQEKVTEKAKKKDESVIINLLDEVFKPDEGNICKYYKVNNFGRYKLTVELKRGTYILCIKEKPELNRGNK